ncbi:MAG: helix-turn-helix domain-containing protein [Acidobacteriota bacterium]|nr:helix-turn-helix domain-containing protein [Acidobacteriota bacterium]
MAAKLLRIRKSLDLPQEKMAEKLNTRPSPVYPTHVSEFERGLREPSLLVLLKYAQIAGVPMDVLVNDELSLPDHLPVMAEYEWVMRPVERRKRKAAK